MPLLAVQNVDIAIIKATTSKFHVVPKEKHVRSAPSPSPLSTVVPSSCTHEFRCRFAVSSLAAATLAAALKMAVGSNAPGHYVHKIITKLVDRLHASKDWLVCPASAPFLSLHGR